MAAWKVAMMAEMKVGERVESLESQKAGRMAESMVEH